jgi:Holliday junction resolvase
MSRPYEKGKLCEWELIKILRLSGFVCIRSPGSGRGKRTWYPDVVAVRNGRAIFIEVKCFSDNRHVPIPLEKFRRMVWLSKHAGVRFFICVKYEDVGSFRCVDLNSYDSVGEKYVMYRREKILSGRDPKDLEA